MSYKFEKELELVNRFRKQAGETPLTELPKGTHASNSCPLAKAFNFDVEVDGDWFDTSEVAYILAEVFPNEDNMLDPADDTCGSIVMPDLLKEFVSKFDTGKYPELEED